MVKYLAQYIPHESTWTAPLRQLLKQDADWIWQPEHDDALEKIKNILTQGPVLQYYNVNNQVTVQADASQSGLGACLLQQGQPIAYASRALTTTEQNYSQIEKEMLAICFACSKFHQYIYGKYVKVQTDHSPLVTIFKKSIGKASPRLQRMLLQLQRYTLNVNYVPGKYMYAADTLSRAYIEGEPGFGCPADMEVMVHSLVTNLAFNAASLGEIKRATAEDQVLQRLRNIIKSGWPAKCSAVSADIKPYWHLRDELIEAEDLLFAGDRIIIPVHLRPQIINLIHESHLGCDKNKSRARNIVYWPGISKDITEVVDKCAICLKYRASNLKEPLMPHPVPEYPWQKVGMDIMTIKGHDYLVVVDYFSKYPEVAKMEYKTAACVILHLKSIFARHGIPEEIMSDNMPFNSKEFHDFTREWGIEQSTSSPRYPQANGQSERAVQTVKMMIKKAQEEGRDPYLALLEYRNTPVTGMPYSPAQMLMSRTLRTKLPTQKKLLRPQVVNAHKHLQQRQERYKHFHDKGSKQLKELAPGDAVHVRHNNVWEPAMVVRKDNKPRSYIIQHDGNYLRRNRRHLMRTTEVPPPDIPLDDDTPSVQPVVTAPVHERHRQQQFVEVPPQRALRGRGEIKRPAKFDDFVCK